jgi:hypothetical protein
MNVHRIDEGPIEPVGRQVERGGIERQQRPAERLERTRVAHHGVAEAGRRRLRWPLVGRAEALAGQHVGMIGRKVGLHEEGLGGGRDLPLGVQVGRRAVI